MPQTKTEIKAILSAAGLRPQKRWGQHFLIDGNLMRKFVDAMEIGPNEVILEVGTGTGNLTELLVERAGWVVAVEIDRGLFACSSERLAQQENLTLVHADILKSKSTISPLVLNALHSALEKIHDPSISEGREPNLVLGANLPYHVATPLLIDLLTSELQFSRFCFSVQKEVADRIVASPKTKDYGPVSVVLQACSKITKITDLPPQVFWPVPNVESIALRLDIDISRFAGREVLQRFIELLRLAFGHRRKTLRYNLRQEYSDEALIPASEAVDIDLNDRAEAIPMGQWLELFDCLQACSL